MTARVQITKIGLFCLACLLMLSSCKADGSSGGLSRADFDFLQLNMSYEQVVAEVGEADRDIGSGIHIMVYDLADGTQVMLSFPSLDSLEAAHLYDPATDTRELMLGSDA